ncbi:MAG: hypothetical protein HQM09_21690 [Candidatus Riflebacteria bacterium]|nr:hypothetical protein [Candidatus Riflebacteria bacterium]
MSRGAFLTPVFVFASTRGGAGKSSLIGHLATWWRDQGRRVAIIDLNGACPMQVRCALPRSQPLQEHPELSEIAGRASGRFHSSFFFENPERISLFPGGLVRNPTPFLTDAALRDLFMQMRGIYDLILINLASGISALTSAESFLTRRGKRDGGAPIGVLVTTTDVRALASIDQIQRTRPAFPYLFAESLFTVFNQIPRGIDSIIIADRLVGPAEARKILKLRLTGSLPLLDEWQRQPLDPAPLVLTDPSALRQTISAFARRLLDLPDVISGNIDAHYDDDVEAPDAGGFGPCIDQEVMNELVPPMKALSSLSERRLFLSRDNVSSFLEVSDNRLRIRLRIAGHGHTLLPIRRDIPFATPGAMYSHRPPVDYPFTAIWRGLTVTMRERAQPPIIKAEPITRFDDQCVGLRNLRIRFRLEYLRDTVVTLFRESFNCETVPPGVPSLHQMLGIASRKELLLPYLQPASVELALTLMGNEPPEEFPTATPKCMLRIEAFRASFALAVEKRLKITGFKSPEPITLVDPPPPPFPEFKPLRRDVWRLTSSAFARMDSEELEWPGVSLSEPEMPPPLSRVFSPALLLPLFHGESYWKRPVDSLSEGASLEPAPDVIAQPSAESFLPSVDSNFIPRSLVTGFTIHRDSRAALARFRHKFDLTIAESDVGFVATGLHKLKPITATLPRHVLTVVAPETRGIDRGGVFAYFVTSLLRLPSVTRFDSSGHYRSSVSPMIERSLDGRYSRRFAVEAVLMSHEFPVQRPAEPDFIVPSLLKSISLKSVFSVSVKPRSAAKSFVLRHTMSFPDAAFSKLHMALVLQDILLPFRNVSFPPSLMSMLLSRELVWAHSLRLELQLIPGHGNRSEMEIADEISMAGKESSSRCKIPLISIGRQPARDHHASPDHCAPRPWPDLHSDYIVSCKIPCAEIPDLQPYQHEPMNLQRGAERSQLPSIQEPSFFRLQRLLQDGVANLGDWKDRPMTDIRMLGYQPSEAWIHQRFDPLIFLLLSASMQIKVSPVRQFAFFSAVSKARMDDLVSLRFSVSSPRLFESPVAGQISQTNVSLIARPMNETALCIPVPDNVLKSPTPFEKLLNHLESCFRRRFFSRDEAVRTNGACRSVTPRSPSSLQHLMGSGTPEALLLRELPDYANPGDPVSVNFTIATGSDHGNISGQPLHIPVASMVFSCFDVCRLETARQLSELQVNPDFPPFHWFPPALPCIIAERPSAPVFEGARELRFVPATFVPFTTTASGGALSAVLRRLSLPSQIPLRTVDSDVLSPPVVRPVFGGAESSAAAFLYFSLFATLRSGRRIVPFAVSDRGILRRASDKPVTAFHPTRRVRLSTFDYISSVRGRRGVRLQLPRKLIPITDPIRREILGLIPLMQRRIDSYQQPDVPKT